MNMFTGGVMEHWLRDEAVDKCMKCNVEFTFTECKSIIKPSVVI